MAENEITVPGTARQALAVKRYHTLPTIQQQTIADHTCQVLRVYTEVFGPPSAETVQQILWHDSAEIVTGDSPFYGKRMFPQLKRALDEVEDAFLPVISGGEWHPTSLDWEKKRIKVCDLIEMLEFGREEVRLGSHHYGQGVVDNITGALVPLVVGMGYGDRTRVIEWLGKNGFDILQGKKEDTA